MRDWRVSRRQILKAVGAAAALGTVLGPEAVLADDEENRKVRWDIINLDTNNHVTSGGQASAFASDNSKITITGSGTFRANSGDPEDVTGGGTWDTFGGAVGAGSGTYRVTKLVSFTPAPGTPPPQNVDMIGPGPGHAGLQPRWASTASGIAKPRCRALTQTGPFSTSWATTLRPGQVPPERRGGVMKTSPTRLSIVEKIARVRAMYEALNAGEIEKSGEFLGVGTLSRKTSDGLVS